MGTGEAQVEAPPRAPARLFPLLALAVLCAALALRLGLLWELHDEHVSLVLVIDSKSYDLWARRVAAGEWLGDGVFTQAPLYPYLMGVVYRLFGADPANVKLLQALLGACSCLLLALAGRSYYGPAAGIAAGVLLAINPTAIFNDSQIQKSSLDLFLVTLLLLLVPRARRGSGAVWWLALGAALGLLALTRENALVLLPALLCWLAREWRAEPRRLATRLGLLLAGLALPLAPVAARNCVAGGEFVLTTPSLGVALYVGNNPTATGGYRPLVPGRSDVTLERRDAAALAERDLGRRLSPGEVSRYWSGRALEYIVGSPGRWLLLLGRKSLLLLNRTELCDTYDQYSYADWSRILRVLQPLVHFGVLLPLAAAGLVLTRREEGAARVLQAMTVLYAASVVLFIVVDRYRFPLVPLLTLFAAAGLAQGAAAVRAARYREAGAACLAALVAVVVTFWPAAPRNELRARTTMLNNIAVGLMGLRRYPEALPYALEAIALDPHFGEAYSNAGVILQRLGRHEEAIDRLRNGLRILPEAPDMHFNLGLQLSQTGRPAEAAAAFEQALRLDPDMALARSWLNFERERVRRGSRAPAAR